MIVAEAEGREGLGEKASLDERYEIAVRMRIGAGKVPTAYLLISCCKRARRGEKAVSRWTHKSSAGGL
jgi:hypothetical protein